MPLEWEELAAALARSPGVEAFASGEGRECREKGIDGWIAVRSGAGTTVCTVAEGATSCRARVDEPEYLGCFDWGKLPPTKPPKDARKLLAVWQANPALDARAEILGMEPGLPFTAVSVRNHTRGIDDTTRIAVRSSTGWHLSREDVGPYEEVWYRDSFDAARTLGGPGWGVVTSAFEGCSQSGHSDWTLRLWREDGAWLALAGTMDLGGFSFAGESHHGARLGVTPLEAGRLRFDVVGEEGGAEGVRERAGVWLVGNNGLVREE